MPGHHACMHHDLHTFHCASLASAVVLQQKSSVHLHHASHWYEVLQQANTLVAKHLLLGGSAHAASSDKMS